MLTRLIIALLMLLVAAACGTDPIELEGSTGSSSATETATPTPPPTDDDTPPGVAVHPDAIWFEVLGVSQRGAEIGTVELIEADSDLGSAWARYAFEGQPPTIDFAEHIVVVVTRPEDACPDEVLEVRLSAGILSPVFVQPPGGCAQPLIPTAYAIAFHRGDLGQRVTLRIREHEAFGDIEQELQLPPYDGPDAPPPPAPAEQMTQTELDEVFADHPLRRCSELPDPRRELVEDWPEGSDSTLRAMDFTVAEDIQGPYAAEHADTFGWFMVDQPAGEWVVGVTGDVEGHRQRLSERHPGESFRVVETPYTMAELAAAQEAILPLHQGDPPVVSASSFFAYLELQVIDPTRDKLDAIAAVVDPDLACVDPVFGGLPADSDLGG